MIELRDLSLKYDRRGIAGIHALDLTISAGEIFALMGPNGCGKTSLLTVIAGERRPDAGSVSVKGKLHHFRLRELPPAANVQAYLISQVDPSVDPEKKLQLARDFADIFEFTFQLRQTCGDLSLGQRQKVMLAAELINAPDVLLMDEPFSHLDPMTRQGVLTALFAYVRQRETTVLWVTHDRDEGLRFADRVAVMQHGKLEQVGRPEDFLRPKNLYVAQFLGHRNFLHVKKFNAVWKTPWGDFHDSFPDDEAYLVIPPTALSASDAAPIIAQVTSQVPQSSYWEISVDWESKGLTLHSHDACSKSKLGLKADLSACFLIPL